MTKCLLTTVTAAGLVALGSIAPAAADVKVGEVGDIQLYLGVHTVGTFQALSQDDVLRSDGTELDDLEPGFQTAWGNLEVRGVFGDEEEIEMFFDLYISSRPHPSTMYGHEGYLLIRGVPENLESMRMLDPLFDKVSFKVGHFEVDYGDHRLRRSDNADVQDNPFIGNFVVDPEMVEVGAEIFSKPGAFNWLVGVSSGTNTEDFTEGRGTALHGKIWSRVPEPLRISASYYAVDHSDNPAERGAGSKTQLFAANRGGGRYGGVFGGGNQPGQVTPANGQDISAWQLDALWDQGPLELFLSYGSTKDSDINGSAGGTPEEEWDYYAADLVWNFTEDFYGGVRFSGADATTVGGVATDGSVQRLQVAFGYWFTEQLLAKVELVTEEMKDFEEGISVSGIRAWEGPSFSGVVAEVSFSF